jgi:4-amino-4-deoxy-L-arabinose transferase-like glycosyltransferase
MNSFIERIIDGKWYIPLIILIAPLLYLHIGLPPIVAAGDGIVYDLYAQNILAGHVYSTDGVNFSDEREPGYPTFLALLYTLSGGRNLQFVYDMQLLMAGLIGVLIYFLIRNLGHPYLGALAGLFTALLPSYALAADDIGPDILFMVLVMSLFLIGKRIIERKGEGAHLFLWFGVLAGTATLTRAQLIFFVPFLLVLYILLLRPSWKAFFVNGGMALAASLLIICSWMFQVYLHEGVFTITQNRPERALYIRARRSELSYAQLTYYGYEVLKQSFTNGNADDFFWQYDAHYLDDVEYYHLATSTAAKAALQQWINATILHNPGHYLYGNLIELMKLNFIEHDFSDTINRYLRAAVYLVLYASFLFGLYQLFKKGSGKIRQVMLLALLFIVYNWLVLTPFDTIPRYNIPYLQFYVLIGGSGIALWLERRKGTKKQ